MKFNKLFDKAFKNFGNSFNTTTSMFTSGSITQINSSSTSTSTINGKTYTGKSISIKNGKVYIDGKLIDENKEPECSEQNITIIVEGNCESINGENLDITIKGDAGSVSTTNGDIYIKGSVKGDVSTTNGDITKG